MLRLILLGCLPLLAQGQPAGAVVTGRYRNLFAEACVPKKRVAKKLDAAFQQLFHGDPQTEAIYYAAGRNANGALGHVTSGTTTCCTEGMSYGMTIRFMSPAIAPRRRQTTKCDGLPHQSD